MIKNEDIEYTLNELIRKDMTAYYDKVRFLKEAGYKIFRNSKGEHKVEHNDDYIYEAFGGIFSEIFGDRT